MLEIRQEKIDYYINKGYIDVSDHAKFKYIVENFESIEKVV